MTSFVMTYQLEHYSGHLFLHIAFQNSSTFRDIKDQTFHLVDTFKPLIT